MDSVGRDQTAHSDLNVHCPLKFLVLLSVRKELSEQTLCFINPEEEVTENVLHKGEHAYHRHFLFSTMFSIV